MRCAVAPGSALCHHQTNRRDGRGCALQLHMQLVSTKVHRRRMNIFKVKNCHLRAATPRCWAWARKSATRVGMAVANYAESAALVKASANASAGRLRVATSLCRAASTIAGAPQADTSKRGQISKIIQHGLVYHPARPCQSSSGNASETTAQSSSPGQAMRLQPSRPGKYRCRRRPPQDSITGRRLPRYSKCCKTA